MPKELIAMGPDIGEVTDLYNQGVIVLKGLVLGRYRKDLKKVTVSVVTTQWLIITPAIKYTNYLSFVL
jgi:hypothetical protein